MSTVAELQQLVRDLNDSWINRDYDRLATFFHPDVVIVTPDFAVRVTGWEPCVDSYRSFVDSATIHQFSIEAADIDLVGASAVASVAYKIDYEIASGRWRGAGRDVLFLQHIDGRWLVLWRLPLPATEEPVQTITH